MTNINLPEAHVKRQMLKIARRRIVLADGGKVGRTELAHLCPVDEIDMLITGESADPEALEPDAHARARLARSRVVR